MRSRQIVFVSTVAPQMRQALEDLFFFHPRQAELHEAITGVLKQTGVPRVELDALGQLTIGVPSGLLQCLFACEVFPRCGRPVGIVLYGRPEPDLLAICHLTVEPAYAYGGVHASFGLASLLVCRIEEIGRRIKGIDRIQLPYRKECYLRVQRKSAVSRLPEAPAKPKQS